MEEILRHIRPHSIVQFLGHEEGVVVQDSLPAKYVLTLWFLDLGFRVRPAGFIQGVFMAFIGCRGICRVQDLGWQVCMKLGSSSGVPIMKYVAYEGLSCDPSSLTI